MDIPTLAEIEANRTRLGDMVATTPVHEWHDEIVEWALGKDAILHLKLELLQRTGTFKPRGALTNLLHLGDAERERGVVAVSAGNHAAGVAYAASLLGIDATVVMPKTANPFRQALCRRYGARIVLTDDIAEAFSRVEELREREGRSFVHPFEGKLTVLGTATVGLELARQVDRLDAVVIPIGGGGLCAGIAAAIRHLHPSCEIFGVEPEGSPVMTRSIEAGRPLALDDRRTIADSLNAPHATPYTFELCRHYLSEIVLLPDDVMRTGMALMFERLKLAVEPAGAAALMTALGPLAERLRGRHTAIVVCGTNIDFPGYVRLVEGAPAFG
ncbi:MAG: threonine/serine dehydratase [Rhodospirillaceae bacterium]|nr:threonine/serine dehydratase [Rhodospirillaceae bacterium]